ncbi:MAG: aminoacetone oxidase family FAD-binding enzyme [Proteobacteria bacterium SW_6_67_9]|nr:MAG: aminoacetone oxidase family FAD-binding enzyme [Proteobacteria bacterium SW_6_67_9]
MRDYDVVIVGGGAAGLLCAIEAGRRGRRVLVIERAERCGKKILMSGGGRCNFTNLFVEPEAFRSRNPHFAKSALARYTQWDFIALVEAHGIAYHEKERGQLFCDGSAKQIVAMLLDECARAGVRVEVAAQVDHVTRVEGGFALETSLGPIGCQSLIVASGGLSIPKMGATGFGYALAHQFGHAVVETGPALVPFTLGADELAHYRDLKGVSASVTAVSQGPSFAAGLVFTHRGVSGPAMLQISSYWSPGAAIHIDWLEGTDAADWLRQRKRERPDAELHNVVAERLPKLGERLNAWPFVPDGTEGYRTAEVTSGGVSTDELSSRTMASKRIDGLYFIGEVVDVTGHLGGYNFQWAWASGYAAGQVV